MKEQQFPSNIIFSSHHISTSYQPKTTIRHEISGDADLYEICQAFENFLLACGFRLNNNQTIGIIENDNF